jgi:hypothetical protein
MRTARDENVPRFVVDKPRLKSESKVIDERKAVRLAADRAARFDPIPVHDRLARPKSEAKAR